MFTGLVEETASVISMERTSTGARLVLASGLETALGDSIAVNGCCLTAVDLAQGRLSFDLLEETLRVTNLGDLAPGRRVNLERALLAQARLGGHFVQGHVDVPAEVRAFVRVGADWRLEVELPARFAQYVIPKGSICVDGISLTVAEVGPESLTVWIIPHTLEATSLPERRAGDRVNLEFDVLAKYVERMLACRSGAR